MIIECKLNIKLEGVLFSYVRRYDFLAMPSEGQYLPIGNGDNIQIDAIIWYSPRYDSDTMARLNPKVITRTIREYSIPRTELEKAGWSYVESS